MMCPVHDQPDCSPILNGCSIPATLVKGAEQVGFEVRATHSAGFRQGTPDEWGTVVRCVYDTTVGRPVYVVEWPDGVSDRWAVYDALDPYEFRKPQGLAHETPVETPVG